MTSWHLDISSYRGITPGAFHYYGNIRDDDFDGPRHEVLRVLDAAGARALSAGDGYLWKAGDDTGRFESKDELIAAGLVIFEEVAAPGETLWNRSSIYVEREVLATKSTEDKCRPVEVDGEVIRVRGGAEMGPEEVDALAVIVGAAKHLMSIRDCPDCEQGKHQNCTGESWCNEHDVPARCPCSINQAGPHRADA